MKFSKDIHGAETMDPNDFGDLITFPLKALADQFFSHNPFKYFNIYWIYWRKFSVQ